MLNDKRALPYSAERYFLTPHGEVLNKDGARIQTQVVNGSTMVELDWVWGRQLYDVAFLIQLVYNSLTLPDYLWDQVEPLYIDGNRKNLFPVNITYRFKNGPIEVREYPGFFYIPHFTNYAISKKGVLINTQTGCELVWTIGKPDLVRNSKGGYRYARVSHNGKSNILLRHRAIALVFLPYDHRVKSMVINHKDGVPGNDEVDNLEWTTHADNNQHAYDLGLKTTGQSPVLVKDLNTGEIKRYVSLSECARSTGLGTSSKVGYRASPVCAGILYKDKLQIKLDDGSPWPEIKSMEINRKGDGQDIMARNVFTGEIVMFTGGTQGEGITKVPGLIINSHVRNNTLIPYDGYNFRYVIGGAPWPEHTERHLLMYKHRPRNPPDGVIVVDTETGEERFVLGVAELAKEWGVSIPIVNNYIQRDIKRAGRYLVKSFKLRETLSPV